MFRTSKAGRMAQGLAAAALIFSLSVTTFAGSANAAPLADCSEAAHARNDATHLLHSAWKVFNGDLKDLASEARTLDKASRKDKSSTVMTTDARAEVASAKAELKSISSQAKADIQAEVELGTACKDEEDDTTTTTTTTTTSTSTTAPSDATAPADSTGSAHTFDTSGLDEKYKDIVEQAIEDMQAVVDEARKAVMDMAAAAETTETTDDTEATTELEAAKAEREKAKEVREEAKAEAKGKSKDKSEAKSSNSGGKGNGKSKNRK